MAADKEKDEMLKRLNGVIDGAWGHVTPGTPDHQYVVAFRKQLHAAIYPPADEQPEPPAAKK